MVGKSPGRELAIETLIDAEPHGAFYRASRILEDAIPSALSSRPNVITKSALVEQAHALQEYEIDSQKKYDEVFTPSSVAPCDNDIDSTLNIDRILSHHGRMNFSQKAAPPQLISALRNVCPSDSLRPLLKSIMTHKAMEGDAETMHLESLIANVCRMACEDKNDDTLLNGLLISSLSILCGSILSTEESEKEGLLKETSDSSSSPRGGGDYLDPRMPSLQVASVLSLLKCVEDSDSTFHLDPDVLKYLGKAASVHEERLEIKRARLEKQTPCAVSGSDEERTLSPIPIVPLTPTDTTPHQEEQQQEEGASPPVQVEEEGEEVEELESDSESTDNSLNPDGMAGLVPHGIAQGDFGIHQDDEEEEEEEDNSSESSSDSEDDPRHIELVNEHDELDELHHHDDDDVLDDEEDDSDIEDDDDDEEGSNTEEDEMLREALALSLADQGPAFEAAQRDVVNQEGNTEEQRDVSGQEGANEAASHDTSLSVTNPAESISEPDTVEEDDKLVLPPLPTAPSHYPYVSLLTSLGGFDIDREETKNSSDDRKLCEFLDPAESKFGLIPSSHALVHLLRYLIRVIRRRREDTKVEEKTVRSIPGGMGSSLFESHLTLFSPEQKEKRNEDCESAITLQLIVSAFLIFDQNRGEAIENLRLAIASEQRNLQGEDGSEDEDDSPLSAEDDPTLALAMNYVEDDVYLEEDVPSDSAQASRSESLESKGMRRKAAAAAHDAAVRLKSLRQQTEAWRSRVKLLSLCTLMSLKCLCEYLRSAVSLWLQRSDFLTESALAEFPVSVLDFEKLMPSTMVDRLSKSLDCLMSIESFRSFAPLLSGDDSSEMDDVFFPLSLYQEALFAWGECLPVLHPSGLARSEILIAILERFNSVSAANSVATDPHSLAALPSSDSEVQLHRLRIMCRRYCVSDLLDGLVGRPSCYSTDNPVTKVDLFGIDNDSVTEPRLVSKLIKLVGSAASSCPQQAYNDLKRLYLALCHRFNIQVLLWDGLFASSELESDGIAISSSSTAGSATDVIRVSPNPSGSLQFDPTKCSDSIAILSSDSPSSAGGSSAHQRASKVWGAVLSSSFYSPKTGIHRWAVRLDKCERGHVFVGVATSQASTRTYVGGDKYGWGVIGTQALWHDRRKIRSDYGATFRSGSTLIVTLDTDAGTLSFSLWKDSNNSSATFSLDPTLQSTTSPTRRIVGGGVIEEWGVAFEGLPLDSKLYPAVGLYQRDDRVTLLNVESGGQTTGQNGAFDGELAGGMCYYPSIPKSITDSKADVNRIEQVKRHNDVLSWDATLYISGFLQSLNESIRSTDGERADLLYSAIPSIAAASTLLPSSIPILSQRFGVALLPLVSRCIEKLHSAVKTNRNLFSGGLRQGKWVIRATGSAGTTSSSESEEYVVEFVNETSGFCGSGIGTTGKSKHGLVSIVGTTNGSALHFVEEWKDDESSSEVGVSSCVVTARTNVDGSRFEGTYRNVQFGTLGQISGVLTVPSSKEEEKRTEPGDIWMTCEAFLCVTEGHLASILAEDIACDHTCNVNEYRPEQLDADKWQRQSRLLRDWVSSPLLSKGAIDHEGKLLSKVIGDLRDLYSSPLPDETLGHGVLGSGILAFARSSSTSDGLPPHLASAVDKIDEVVTSRSGGNGSLSFLCPKEYSATRKEVIMALAYHGNSCEDIINLSAHPDSTEVNKGLIGVWRRSLRIMEDGLRSALSSTHDANRTRKQVIADTCKRLVGVSQFLLKMKANSDASTFAKDASLDDIVSFYSTIRSQEDLSYIQAEMESSTKRALLRASAIHEITTVLSMMVNKKDVIHAGLFPIESIVTALPRLMGRNRAKRGNPREDLHEDDLGGYYLGNLTGALSTSTDAVCFAVSNIYASLGSVLELYTNGELTDDSSTTSLILAVLAAYVLTIRPVDVPPIILSSHLVERISIILQNNREAVRSVHADLSADGSKESAMREIQNIVTRDSSRSVLQAATSILHVMCFQLSHFVTRNSSDAFFEAFDGCLKVVVGELDVLIPLVESVMQEEFKENSELFASADWESWCGICLSDGYKRPKMNVEGSPLNEYYRAGILYMNEHGTVSSTVGLSPGSQKVSSRSDSVKSKSKDLSSSGQPRKIQVDYCREYLTQWLDIVACLSKSKYSLQMVADGCELTDRLLCAIGLSCGYSTEGTLTSVSVRNSSESAVFLPARYRARILRLLRDLLILAAPSEALVEALLSLCGRSVISIDGSSESDDCFVSRETVSLLRYLHLPIFPDWRKCVLRVVSESFGSQEGHTTSEDLSLGIRLFFGGSISSLRRGAYVLLKPPAAQLLSSDAQASPSSKAHGSAGNTGSPGSVSTHHIAGNGTEGIVSGLCRTDAAAGVVSSVLTKNGACEVILMNRHRLSSTDDRSRQSLTVRALRTSLSDVALAEEVPLAIDPSINVEKVIGPALISSLDSLTAKTSIESTDDMTSESVADGKDWVTLDVEKVYSALATIRSAVSITSSKKALQEFQDANPSSDVFARVLEMACNTKVISNIFGETDDKIRSESLSELPRREAQYAHLTAMVREINIRREILNSIPQSFWEKKLAEQSEARESLISVKKVDGREAESLDAQESTGTGSGPTVLAPSPRPPARGLDEDGGRGESGGVLSQSTLGSNNSMDEDEDGEAASTAAAHLREAAIAQMAELGLPRSWSELALSRTGGTNIEAAVHFCLERGGDMERLIAEEQEREHMMQRQSSGGSSSRLRSARGDNTNQLLSQLLEMGFPRRWCAEALAATGNNVDEALTWILTNGERLSAEDLGLEEDDGPSDDDDGDDDDDDDSAEDDDDGGVENEGVQTSDSIPQSTEAADMASPCPKLTSKGDAEDDLGWSGTVCPLRFISGRSIINSKTLSVSGLPAGGFSSVGTKGILLTTGKWYYEAILETAGCLQIGWADGSFSGHCNADRGDGCGDGPSSWAFDGWRRYRWHESATEWGCRWKEGDVIGCLVDLDEHVVTFTLNGKAEEIGMGVAFSGQGFRPCGGVYACVSFNRREKLRLILGGKSSEPFKHQPPSGYKGVGEAVLDAARELDHLLEKESVLLPSDNFTDDDDTLDPKRFLCDLSDGEHGHELFAWQHRYYGSDASVHLGSTRRSKQSSGKSSNERSLSSEMSAAVSISRRVEQQWKGDDTIKVDSHTSRFTTKLQEGYEKVVKDLSRELRSESVALGVLYCRKLILQIMITLGRDFDTKYIFPPRGIDVENEKLAIARNIWSLLDTCVSLRSAGWVGEAGAMAVAAEALGLGISSAQTRHASSEMRAGILPLGQADDYVSFPSAGISQVLSSVLLGDTLSEDTTGSSLAACSEASIGSSGSIVFLKPSLQALVSNSPVFQDLLLAVISRSVRLLAVVDYSGEDSSLDANSEGEDMDEGLDGSSRSRGVLTDDETTPDQPDARLTLFFTGLLLSCRARIAPEREKQIMESLFEAWSIGLLSASAPWRMVCALSAAGILNTSPEALLTVIERFPTVSRFYSRLHSTVARRIWAERAAVPVCSRYCQALIELLASVRRAIQHVEPESSLFCEPLRFDAATPASFNGMKFLTQKPSSIDALDPSNSCWEWEDGWLSSDAGWEVWTGSVECMKVEWKAPSRSAVRTLMDGGEGPPMLREGCKVMRGLDWEEDGSGSINGNEDGKEQYDTAKAKRDKEKKSREESKSESQAQPVPAESEAAAVDESDPVEESAGGPRPPSSEDETVELDAAGAQPESDVVAPEPSDEKKTEEKKQKIRKIPSPKLPLGTVLSIEPWNGMPAMARRVKWDLTGIEGVYRFGGDGGRYDICHVEVNKKSTRVRKRHPFPESAEQCAFRHGFGVERKHSVLLRLRRKGETKVVDGETEIHRLGILEWPGFGAAIRVDCIIHSDGAVTLTERELLYGSKDAGWEARFGQPSYVPGTVMVMTPTGSLKDQEELDATSSFLSLYEELLGSSSFTVEALRDRANGKKIRLTSEMRLLRSRQVATDLNVPQLSAVQAPNPPPMRFDSKLHASSISLSRDGRTITCTAPDGRGTAFASTGFTKGVHYWEVKLEQADIGSIFIGVAEKPSASGSGGSPFGQESQPRLNRWHGWGFVNFRATYSAGAERVYGAHCHAGDTIGVLLDCDAGRVSFFFDGLKYGEHILNDLGCAFENLSPFGFNADGCGSGGAGQGAPSGVEGGRGGRYPAQGSVRPKAYWPVVGLRNPGDRVTLSTKWMTSLGIDGPLVLQNTLAVDELLASYDRMSSGAGDSALPDWFVEEAFSEYERWRSRRWLRSVTRASGPVRMATFGLDVDLDTSPFACASACASLGLKQALLPGDRVMVKRSAGRMLELPEEAIVLGAYQGRLYYRIVSQKSEGGSLTEGGGRAWFWDESEVVADGIELIGKGRGMGIPLPTLHRFGCLSAGGLKIVYEGGAVVRSDLEIIDVSVNIGTIPLGTVIPQKDVLERRVNSCGVVRYRIHHGDISNGWISAWIRGGKEEAIVEPVPERSSEDSAVEDIISQTSFATPLECAQAWFDEYSRKQPSSDESEKWAVTNVDEFKALLSQGLVPGLSSVESDFLLVAAVGAIADYSQSGDAVDCSYDDIAGPISLAVASANGKTSVEAAEHVTTSPGANQAALTTLSNLNVQLPEAKALMARTAMLRALNRRTRLALPWLSIRPSQEGTAIFGGLSGHGASVDRVGRYRLPEALDEWVQVPSIGTRVRHFRRLFFTCVKRSFLESVMECTTTPTPLSHDEYELPREIRTVRINRLKARRAMAGSDTGSKRKHSTFSQLQSETRSWGGAGLRRGFIAKGHGGQKRAFKVKLIGEGVNDYSGPYREVFTDAMQEVSDVDENGHGALAVLDATPNNAAGIGDNRDLFMFSTGDCELTTIRNSSVGTMADEESRIRDYFVSLVMPRDEPSREVEESLVFLGRLVGTACRHGIPVELPLPLHSVWKSIAEEPVNQKECLKELDLLAFRQLSDSDEDNLILLQWQQRMLNSFMDGLSNVFPDEILTLMTGQEIRDVFCGKSDIDVDLLRRVVEYEGYDEDDEVIEYFWETLREMDSNQRKKFLQFVWARNRLPMKESAFDAPFKIQKDTASNADAALPSASTCFFSLTLPEYSSKDILKQKLLFAIENVVTMESDYVTNDAEVGEGWRNVV